MRVIVELDDGLVAQARGYTGIMGNAALVRAALTALVQREAARRKEVVGWVPSQGTNELGGFMER